MITASRHLLRTAVLLVMALFLLMGQALAAAPTVRIGTLKLVGGAPIFIALEKGYFQQEGLNVQIEWFAAAAPVAVATAAGSIDVGATGISAALFNSIASGSKIYLVADRGSERKGYPLNAIVVRKAAYEAGLKSIASLKGKKIGITSLGSTFHYQIGRLLELEGLSLDDVELVPLRTTQLVMDSVRQGTVDAAILSPPWGAVAEDEGWGKIMLWASDKMPYQVTGVFISESFRKQRDVAVKFMKAYIRGVRYYHDAVFGNKRSTPQYDEVLRIIEKYTDADRDSIARSLAYIPRDARPDVDDLIVQQEWYKKHGMLSRVVPTQEFVDLSLIDEALKQLD